MRILVYGAGVQGCELAHRLAQNEKNTVTLLARGEWKERIDQKGLTIRHWAQLKTTVDRVPTIETLAPEESYDIVFVTVQAGQLPEILPVLKQNKSEFFVFVGNQPHARSVLQAMQRPADKIAFGFQSSGGHRDVDKVVTAHVGVGMTIGGATAPLSGVFRYRVKTAFEGAKYKLTFVSDMDGWLKCHLALILPACYLCYACKGDLSKATKEQKAQAEETVEKDLRDQMVLDALAEKLDVQVSQSDVFNFLASIAQQYGMDPNNFIQAIIKNGQLGSAVQEVGRSKGLLAGMRAVKFTADGEVVDLSAFLGEAAEDEESESVEAASAAAAVADELSAKDDAKDAE